MRQRFAPQHDITGEGLFVPASDSAWDLERIKAEIAELRKGTPYERAPSPVPVGPDDPAHQHVWARYFRGRTRFDLHAEGIGDYLDNAKEPETFQLKRLESDVRAKARRLVNQGLDYEGYEHAFLHGVIGLDNGDPHLAKLLAARASNGQVDGKKVTADAVVKAASAVAYEIITECGAAVLSFSEDLSEEEKKA